MTCKDCGEATLSDGICVDCSNRRIDDYPRLRAIVFRLHDYISFECNPSYDWSAKKVYDDLKKIVDPNYKPTRPSNLDEIQCKTVEKDGSLK